MFESVLIVALLENARNITIERSDMPKRTRIEPHLTLDQLNLKIRRSRDSVTRQQLRVVKCVMIGMTQRRVAEKLGYSPAWVHTIIRRYNEDGPDALRDHRKDNPGRPFKLSKQIRDEMRELVSLPPPDGNLWTGPLLIDWVRERTGDAEIDPKRGWEWLKQLDCKARVTRRRKRKSQELVDERFNAKVS